MARVERGNVVLHIPDDDAKRYVEMGYNLTDEAGNILEEALPKSVGVLQTAYVEYKRRIAELEKEVETLKAQLAEKPAKPKRAKAE